MSEVQVPNRKDEADKGIVLFLSLYLLLLAFFIVLNSISTIEEEKRYAVLTSVALTFGWEGSRGVEAQPPAVVEGQFLEPEKFHEKIADLVKTAFPLAQVKVVTPNRLMQVSVPAESLFVADEARFGGEAVAFLAEVADALGRNPLGVRYEAEIVVAGAWITARELAGGETLDIARAGALGSELGRLGAPPGTVVTGVDHDESGEIRLMFHIRPEEEPRVDFRELAR